MEPQPAYLPKFLPNNHVRAKDLPNRCQKSLYHRILQFLVTADRTELAPMQPHLRRCHVAFRSNWMPVPAFSKTENLTIYSRDQYVIQAKQMLQLLQPMKLPLSGPLIGCNSINHATSTFSPP